MGGFKLRYFYIFMLLFLVVEQGWAKTSKTKDENILDVAIMVHGPARSEFFRIFKTFTKKSKIEIHHRAYDDSAYKEMINKWLLNGENSPDVIYWQSGARLHSYIPYGHVKDITALWQQQNFDRYFSQTQDLVQLENKYYAVPFSYYPWGLYYVQKFSDENGGVAKTWDQLLSQCRSLRKMDRYFSAIPLKEHWPVAAWFDYLNLRINGLKFHHELLKGSISFTDARVRSVFEHWAQLQKAECFMPKTKKSNWRDILPYLYRKKIAYVLMGNFVMGYFPDSIREDINFVSFPKIKEIPRYEEAPTDVFLISNKTKKEKQALEFLKFIANAETQSLLASGLKQFPVNKESQLISSSEFDERALKHLSTSAGMSQYFDRDTSQFFAPEALKILAKFAVDANMDNAMQRLEALRLKIFKK